jgi:hypothetical protein
MLTDPRSGERMRIVLMMVCVLICGPTIAHAKTLLKTVSSGVETLMYSYATWKSKDCSPEIGVVKVLAKPQHGKLTPKETAGTIRTRGLRYAGPAACIGKPTPVFKVYYISEGGFRGSDRFKIEVTYRGRPPDVDTFTVDVK